MINDHSDSKKGNPMLPLHGLLFPFATGFLYAPSHRQVAHTTAIVTLVMEHWLERDIAK